VKKNFGLGEIQRMILGAIKNPDQPHAELSSVICEKPPITSQQRLRIYQEAYKNRMLESLRDDFPRVEKILGSDEFDKNAAMYLESHPSRYASLAEASQHFPQWMKESSDELYEAASVDWIEILASHQVEVDRQNVLGPQEIGMGIPFVIIKNATLFSFIGKTDIFVSYRSWGEIRSRQMRPEEFHFFQMISGRMEVEELAKLVESLRMDEGQLQNLFSNWVRDEVIYCKRRDEC